MLKKYNEDLYKIRNSIKTCGEKIIMANRALLEKLTDCKKDKENDPKAYLKNLSSILNDIDNEIIKVLALTSPEARDLREVIAYFKITNELLRASQNSRSLIKILSNNCSEMDQDIIKEYVIPLEKSSIKALTLAMSMLDIDDIDELKDIFHEVHLEEDKTDELYGIVEKKIFKNLKDNSDFQKVHYILKAIRRFEKIADRATSIANLVLYIFEGGSLERV